MEVRLVTVTNFCLGHIRIYIMNCLNKINLTRFIPKNPPPNMIQKCLRYILSPSLYSYFFKSPQQPVRVSSLIFNRYTLITIASIAYRVAMRRKTRAGLKVGTPTSARKLKDEEDLVIATVDSDSGGDESGVQRSDKDVKRAKVESSDKEKSDNGIATRKIILGRPISGKAFFNCGVIKLFSDLGFESLIVDLPKICYPSLVREFYLNLHENPSGQIVSFVSDTKITLSPMFLNAIIQAPPSPVSIHTKRGFKQLNDFSVKDQFLVLFGQDVPTETFPSTTQILPLAHVVFKVSIENLCPRLGTRSNLSAQDVVVVSMLWLGSPLMLGT